MIIPYEHFLTEKATVKARLYLTETGDAQIVTTTKQSTSTKSGVTTKKILSCSFSRLDENFLLSPMFGANDVGN